MIDPRNLSLLRIHDACRGLSDDEVDAIAANVDVLEMAAGELVYSVGQDLDAVYIVVGGRLKMTVRTPVGASRTVSYISAGDQFGALALVSDEEVPVDVSVDEKAVLFRLPKDAVLQLVDQFPAFRRNLLRKIGHSVHQSLDWQRKPRTARIVSFIHTDQHSRQIVTDIAANLSQVGERVGILCDSGNPARHHPDIPFKSLRKETGEYIGPSELRATLEQ